MGDNSSITSSLIPFIRKIMKYFLCIPVFMFCVLDLFSQVPQGINYQAVLRDNGSLFVNSNATVEFRILQGPQLIYGEAHGIVTDQNGRFTSIIGEGDTVFLDGISMGVFSDIDWTSGPYELNVRFDIGNGSIDMGTQRMVSVPYSLFSQRAATVDSLSINDSTYAGGDLSGPFSNFRISKIQGQILELTNPGVGQVLRWTGSQWEPGSSDDADSNPINELQSLSLTGNTLSISNGNQVTLAAGTSYTAGSGIALAGGIISNTGDVNASDDITTSSIPAGDISGTYANVIVSGLRGMDISPNITSATDGQILEWNGTSMQWDLANSGGQTYTAGVGISIVGNVISNTQPDLNLSLTGAGATSVLGGYPNFTISSTDNVNDADADVTNELQTLSLSGQNLSLSNGGGTVSINVNDADADPANELQTLSLIGNTLSISSGNSLSLPGGTSSTLLEDTDQDTKIQVEESNDEDIIRFDLEGVEVMTLETSLNGQPILNPNPGKTDIFIGRNSGNNYNVSLDGDNTALGNSALFQNGSGAIAPQATLNTSIGSQTLEDNTIGSGNTAVGQSALSSNISGNNNTAIGYNAFNGGGATSFSNSTAIGHNAEPTGSDQIRLGNSSISSIGGFANWTNLSDGKFKESIKEDVVGLQFILKLRPITYQLKVDLLASILGEEILNQRMIEARNRKAQIRQSGFVAQEVEQIAMDLGFDFSGIDKPDNSQDFYGLRYSEFVVPLVKAIQEQQEIIAKQEAKNETLTKLVLDLQNRLDQVEESIHLTGK